MTNEERLLSIKSIVLKEKTRQEFREEQRTKLLLDVETKRSDSEILLKVVELFKILGGETESELLTKLDKFVSFGLSFIFGEEYSFVSVLNVAGKDVRLDFKVKKGSGELLDITKACGGGIAEVVSLLLRLFFIIMDKDENAPFLMLDTALINLSDIYASRMSLLLKDICYGLGIQIILLTHTFQFAEFADHNYELLQENGRTISRRIK